MLAVPVDALLALASGGYALEEVGFEWFPPPRAGEVSASSTIQAGLVQVSGSGVAAGQTIVVPQI